MLSTQASHIYFRFVVVNRPWFAFFCRRRWSCLVRLVQLLVLFCRFALFLVLSPTHYGVVVTSVAHTQLLLGLIKNVALVVALATYLVTRGSRARIDKDWVNESCTEAWKVLSYLKTLAFSSYLFLTKFYEPHLYWSWIGYDRTELQHVPTSTGGGEKGIYSKLTFSP